MNGQSRSLELKNIQIENKMAGELELNNLHILLYWEAIFL
jgi:hypothetical protein